MEKLMKLIEKKKAEGKEMDPMQKDAKMSMLKALRDEMSGMMKGDLDGAHKVEVSADNKDDLKMGLDKAKEALDDSSDEESPEHEAMESPEEEKSEHDDLSFGSDSAQPSDDKLSDEEIEMLQKLLAKAKMQRI